MKLIKIQSKTLECSSNIRYFFIHIFCVFGTNMVFSMENNYNQPKQMDMSPLALYLLPSVSSCIFSLISMFCEMQCLQEAARKIFSYVYYVFRIRFRQPQFELHTHREVRVHVKASLTFDSYIQYVVAFFFFIYSESTWEVD